MRMQAPRDGFRPPERWIQAPRDKFRPQEMWIQSPTFGCRRLRMAAMLLAEGFI
jgi:hypothetical protein